VNGSSNLDQPVAPDIFTVQLQLCSPNSRETRLTGQMIEVAQGKRSPTRGRTGKSEQKLPQVRRNRPNRRETGRDEEERPGCLQFKGAPRSIAHVNKQEWWLQTLHTCIVCLDSGKSLHVTGCHMTEIAMSTTRRSHCLHSIFWYSCIHLVTILENFVFESRHLMGRDIDGTSGARGTRPVSKITPKDKWDYFLISKDSD
jgi:hypothetical protein